MRQIAFLYYWNWFLHAAFRNCFSMMTLKYVVLAWLKESNVDDPILNTLTALTFT
jgi:hypothetical protein